jgi:hypothetical protein
MAHMLKKMVLWAGLLAALLTSTGCFGLVIETEHMAKFPEKTFAQARHHIAGLNRHAGRSREGRELHLMVYSGHDGEFTRITVPTWVLGMIDEDGKPGRHSEGTQAESDRFVKRYVDVDSLDLHRLLDIGPGLLLEVEDNGDETHLLIWLE